MKICVDAGHGGIDPGAMANGVIEKKLALVYAHILAGALCERGYNIVMTRATDDLPAQATNKTDGLRARYVLANNENCDAFVSCHFNAGASSSRSGFEVFHSRGSERGRALASSIYMRATGATSPIRVHPDESPECGGRKLAVLRGTRMPAALIEFAYVTNLADARNARDVEWAQRIIEGCAIGIDRWAKGIA